MSTQTAANNTSTPAPIHHLHLLNPIFWWRYWIKPRSSNRDAAFRERTIRVAVAVMLIMTVLSVLSSLIFYDPETGVFTYTNISWVMIFMFGISAVAVNRQNLIASGQLLVAGMVVGALGATIISGFWYILVLPAFMLIILITALALPRSALLPVGIIIVALYTAVTVIQENQGLQADMLKDPAKALSVSEAAINVFFLVAIEVLFLRQLRLEFDSRLAAMSEALGQAEQAREEAHRASQAKSEFLASMSHEFRTPLNAIIGYADIMIAGMAGILSDKQTQINSHIRHNSKRLLGMINNTLDMAKIEAGKIEVRVTEMSPQDVIGQVIGGMESLAQNKNITLTAEFDERTPKTVRCDSPKLQQILTNLLGNAIKFTSEGGVKVEVGGNGDNCWFFKVKDSGIGMPDDAASYIFDAFSQVDTVGTRGVEGTGLGLAIVKRHVDYMGGSVEVETALGKGTTFIVTLPCDVQERIISEI
ncbi:MAG: hypothetical protein JXQ72_04855 [Anaerolineae bacterium]|nr:hypothetical protein [Anaerolineae bacterium]